ncbi:MAG TPA: response regulator, partial [Chitinophagales bacterium]|nr:response regulator [Chitinophagales bacterium]
MAKQITSGTILVIDDDRSIRRTLKEILEYEGYKVEEAEDGMDGMVKIKTNNYDAILCDIKMARMDGLEVLDNAVKLKPDLPLIMISGHGTMETAVQAVKKGAYDFIAKPLDLNRLLITVRNALDRSDLAAQAKQYKQRATRINEIIGQSAAIKR